MARNEAQGGDRGEGHGWAISAGSSDMPRGRHVFKGEDACSKWGRGMFEHPWGRREERPVSRRRREYLAAPAGRSLCLQRFLFERESCERAHEHLGQEDAAEESEEKGDLAEREDIRLLRVEKAAKRRKHHERRASGRREGGEPPAGIAHRSLRKCTDTAGSGGL
ncbi:hypothetical protein cyc_03412 [Cyclospora cayetanensis]|uniref:Uncharacterized protein n=1 Tax=Cyclospora cayetanensis TaxID=88456 RepID=A0A1D3CWB9_9EIME|nr:hypothetical protein cyc_03412 [Cyclospora cayetanensis]